MSKAIEFGPYDTMEQKIRKVEDSLRWRFQNPAEPYSVVGCWAVTPIRYSETLGWYADQWCQVGSVQNWAQDAVLVVGLSFLLDELVGILPKLRHPAHYAEKKLPV